MSQENEIPEFTPLPPAPEVSEAQPLAAENIAPEPQEVRPKPETRAKKISAKKIAGIALLFLLAGLSIAVYFMMRERTRTFQNLETRLAQLESLIHTLQDKQSAATAQNDRAVETLKKDLQKFKDQSAEQFATEDRVLQELRSGRPPSPQETAPAFAPMEPRFKQAEPTTPPDPARPTETKPALEPEKNKETQHFIEFVESALKKIFELLKSIFQIVWDFLSDTLKKPV